MWPARSVLKSSTQAYGIGMGGGSSEQQPAVAAQEPGVDCPPPGWRRAHIARHKTVGHASHWTDWRRPGAVVTGLDRAGACSTHDSQVSGVERVGRQRGSKGGEVEAESGGRLLIQRSTYGGRNQQWTPLT